MTTRLVLVCHGATSATRRAAFPADEPLEHPAPVPDPPRADLVLCAPHTRCRQTAAALGLTPHQDDGLRDRDYGAWRGRTLDEVTASDPAAVHAWLTDPAAAPHGGESTQDLLARVGGWLDALPRDHHRIVAITTPAVIKAAVVRAIAGTPASFWRIDVPPLSRTELSGRAMSWTLRIPVSR
ncbi:histidine phosphatase family protein [Actinophytocola glycyrrhizae]|uniref:Histidine phosphatase family protein n=1 Tax=Actinophytocola glycyrrhizae TaxID=2044873 RepID=A0ABV9S7L9_9PSEU